MDGSKGRGLAGEHAHRLEPAFPFANHLLVVVWSVRIGARPTGRRWRVLLPKGDAFLLVIP